MKNILTIILLYIVGIMASSCNVIDNGNKYIGKWENIAPRGDYCGGGCPTSLNIYKDGSLFIIDISSWSEGGRDFGIVNHPRAETATFKDGMLEISGRFGQKINIAESSGHLFIMKDGQNFEFSKKE